MVTHCFFLYLNVHFQMCLEVHHAWLIFAGYVHTTAAGMCLDVSVAGLYLVHLHTLLEAVVKSCPYLYTVPVKHLLQYIVFCLLATAVYSCALQKRERELDNFEIRVLLLELLCAKCLTAC